MTDGTDGAPADLPYVDGRDASPDELRAEVAKESDPHVQRVEEARDELVVVADELGRRLTPRYWLARVPPGLWVGLVAVAALVVVRIVRRPRPSQRDASTSGNTHLL